MAVPPAYRDVRYSADPSSHLQAVGIDAAGRLQYRYHADWEKVREQRKAHRLARLVAALPKIRRKVSAYLSGDEPTREFALSAVIELIARTAIRPGNESYARLNGTRGATTMLKSNVTLEDDSFVLTFKAKGGKAVRKECDAAKLVRAIGILRTVPGKRMFQYRDNSGTVRTVSTTTVNAFLREIAGIKISLKDFRTLMASAVVLESLSRITPAASERGRKKQVLDAVRAAADELSNTPAICRKSYVHDTIVTAFEDGILERFAATMKGYRTQAKREALLAQVVTAAAALAAKARCRALAADKRESVAGLHQFWIRELDWRSGLPVLAPGAGAREACSGGAYAGAPFLFCRFCTRSSTTAGSASVEVSPRLEGSSSAILRRMRRMILPERVFGRPGANWIWSGEAIGPMSLRTQATSSLRNSSVGSVPAISVT